MAVVVQVHNAAELVSAQTHNGVGEFAGLLGLGETLASVVDDKIADQLREKLAEQGVLADVYTTANPGAPSGGMDLTPLLMLGAIGVGAYLLFR